MKKAKPEGKMNPQMANSLLLTILTLITFLTPTRSQNDTAPCPLDFTPLRHLIANSSLPPNLTTLETCEYIRQGLRLVQSYHLLKTDQFLPPLNASVSCWSAYQSLISAFLPNFSILSSCGFDPSWISYGCMNITSRAQFQSVVPQSATRDVTCRCNQSLEKDSTCATCTATFLALLAPYLNGGVVGNVSDCSGYPSIYTAAFLNYLGPTDKGTAKCLFLLDFSRAGGSNNGNNKRAVIFGVSTGLSVVLGLAVLGCRFVGWRRYKKRNKIELGSQGSIGESITLVKFTLEEIKEATNNFSRHNIIGSGGYGNVYRGELVDGSQVAVKRFKNCSPSGDANFVHEVEVIASIRHVNLLALRGYCTATTQLEGHQRIIVCDLIRNGSLYDHLFGEGGRMRMKLSWPIRQRIALGMAKGLAYLHHGAMPAIIHRDIKASNVLLDENFEPKLADFGLAKFVPDGMTHLSTKAAGTMGHVAPEYALYGQLTQRSDVYSFGVVLLQLLSGKKALEVTDDGQSLPVTDWAWSLVRQGRTLNVIEDGVPELGTEEVLDKYVLVAVLCSHPHLYARPTMDQVVKMLEMEVSVPSVPARPISLVAEMEEIQRSISSGGAAGRLFTSTGYQVFTLESDHPSGRKAEASSSLSLPQ